MPLLAVAQDLADPLRGREARRPVGPPFGRDELEDASPGGRGSGGGEGVGGLQGGEGAEVRRRGAPAAGREAAAASELDGGAGPSQASPG